MPEAASPRLGLVGPTGATDALNIGDDQIRAIITALEATVPRMDSGTLAARPPAPTIARLFYEATDTGQVFYWNGTAWRELGAQPIGSLLDYGGAGDPADTSYLLADGRLLSRTTYAGLFAVYGTTHGAGDGSTTFGIPDCRGRVAAGPDNMGTAKGDAARLNGSDALGQAGGADETALTAAQLPAHAHPDTFAVAAAQPWTTGWNAPIGDSSWIQGTRASGAGQIDAYANAGSNVTYDSGSHAHTLTGAVSNSTGGGGVHSARQPTLILNKIVRVR